jgi:hypothetical protein
MPGFGSMGRQLAMLPALWASHKINWDEPTNQSILLGAFGVVVLMGFVALQLTLSRIAKARDSGRVETPGESPFMKEKAEDGTVSVSEYDMAKVKEFKMQFMMSCGIVTFLHIKWAVPATAPTAHGRTWPLIPPTPRSQVGLHSADPHHVPHAADAVLGDASLPHPPAWCGRRRGLQKALAEGGGQQPHRPVCREEEGGGRGAQDDRGKEG